MKKKFARLIAHLICVFLISPILSADVCDDLSVYLNHTYKFDSSYYTKEDHGVFFDTDYDYPFIGKFIEPHHSNTNLEKYFGLDIFEINNLNIAQSLIEEERETVRENIIEELSSDEIFLRFQNDDMLSLQKSNYNIIDIEINPALSHIKNIDSKNFTFDANVNIEISWTDLQILEFIVKKINPSSNFRCMIKPGKIDYPNEILYPSLKVTNLIDFQKYEVSDLHIEYYHSSEKNNEHPSLTSKYSVFTRGTLDANLDLKKFPYDYQYLDVEMQLTSEFNDIYLNPVTITSSMDNEFWNLNIPGWEPWSYYPAYAHDAENQTISTLDLEIKREVTFYIYKIFLPIIFLLIISWSTFWLKTEQLESRITISLVCLLSLIAYTFVADANLPELGYLTSIDVFLLISYFFASIPPLITVTSRYLESVERSSLSSKIESIMKKVIVIYFILIIGSMYYFNNISHDAYWDYEEHMEIHYESDS